MNIRRTLLPFLLVILLASAHLVPLSNGGPNTYRDYDTFMKAFKDLADQHPSLISYQTVGNSVENRNIIMFQVGNPEGGRVLFDGAIHGEESLAGELLYSYAKWLVTSNDPLANQILTGTCTLLIPALDADEYNIVRTNAHHVDLNRNFATDWQYGGSTDPNDWYYRGSSPLSEPESQTIVRVLETYNPNFYVNVHRGGSILYENSYGNRTYYSILSKKMTDLSKSMNVTPYWHTMISGPGYSTTDAAKAGITSYLFEVMDWTTNPPLSQIDSSLLPRFLTVAAVLSQECQKESKTLFSDGFESGDFSAWDGTHADSGDTITVTSAVQLQGTYSANYATVSNGEGAYSYKNINTTGPELSIRASFRITSSGIVEDDDRFYCVTLVTAGDATAKVGWRKTGGVTKWSLIIGTSTDYLIDFSQETPLTDKWYTLQVLWLKNETNGGCEVRVDSSLISSIRGLNTSSLGDIIRVRVGVTETYNCTGTTLYSDSVTITNGEMQTFPPWDLNEDGRIDLMDMIILAAAYKSFPGTPNWNPKADLNMDMVIDLMDAIIFAGHYGETYP